ncbi:hypothetical protein Sango_0646400 [Sesamum angolense]|uniref:Retrotransposon gag domain-containing protein n=1 Tax=Sesamum angolense TaxID=2727404 RepID=A0AAE2C287_9LAMI|nr:hypothetical protein Sango_0646400 [Sesamum angolense]
MPSSSTVPPPFPLALTPLPSLSPSFSQQLSPLVTVKPPKLHLPLFYGSNPLYWVFQAENFFSYYHTPQEQCLDLVSFYMTGDALSWFKWMYKICQLSLWDAFVESLELLFGLSSYVNHEAALFKLHQRGSVAKLQVEFERLCNQVIGLPPESFLNCFLFTLRPNIQWELAILRPSSLSQAMG